MTLILLLITGVLLALGLVLLPPVTGAGIGSLVSRSWLLFGMLVFAGHYLHYLQEGRRGRLRRHAVEPKAHYRPARRAERSAARR